MHRKPLESNYPARHKSSDDGRLPFAVLIDGSALFLQARNLYEDRQLDYIALGRLIADQIQGLSLPSVGASKDLWVMWTSADPKNAGQSRFLDFAERELRWTVRRFVPNESFMIEPRLIVGEAASGPAASRLVRFDAAISFAIGRLCSTRHIVVVSDSFALAGPLQRASKLLGSDHLSTLVFFGLALDTRWHRLLRDGMDSGIKFVDLDKHDSELFEGVGRKEVIRADNLEF